MKQLHHLINIIPVIAKSDTLTATELKSLKLKVEITKQVVQYSCIGHWQIMNEIKENGIRIYTGEIDEEDDSSEIRDLKVSSSVEFVI